MSGKIDVRPLTKLIGAEILGIEFDALNSPSTMKLVHDTLIEYGVVFLRDVSLDMDGFVQFGRSFGDLELHAAIDGPPDHPEIMVLHTDAESKWVAGEGWHADLTCNEHPPEATMLYLHTVPETGGDTLFASMTAAYDALSDPMKNYLAGLGAVHDGNPLFRSVFPDIDREYPVSVHPIVREHPVSGRKLLYVNQEYTTRIEGVPKKESDQILSFLFQHVHEPRFQARFKWQPKSLAFWDNRCTQHTAIWDYFPETRSGYRVQLKTCGSPDV